MECRICVSAYNVEHDCVPIVHPCGHSICLRCRCMLKSGDCPVCRATLPRYGESVVNAGILHLMRLRKPGSFRVVPLDLRERVPGEFIDGFYIQDGILVTVTNPHNVQLHVHDESSQTIPLGLTYDNFPAHIHAEGCTLQRFLQVRQQWNIHTDVLAKYHMLCTPVNCVLISQNGSSFIRETRHVQLRQLRIFVQATCHAFAGAVYILSGDRLYLLRLDGAEAVFVFKVPPNCTLMSYVGTRHRLFLFASCDNIMYVLDCMQGTILTQRHFQKQHGTPIALWCGMHVLSGNIESRMLTDQGEEVRAHFVEIV